MDALYRVIRPVSRGSFGSIILIAPKNNVENSIVLKIVEMVKSDPDIYDPEYDCMKSFQSLQLEEGIPVLGCVRVRRLNEHIAYVAGLSPLADDNDDDNENVIYQITAMPHIRGPTLRGYLGGLVSTGQICVDWNEIICKLLRFHAQSYDAVGLIHKDLKLGNIMYHPVTKCLKVIDFNLSARTCNETRTAWRCGTLCYMPPERLVLEDAPLGMIHDAGDLWAIGVIMSTLALTGHKVDGHGVFDPAVTDTVYHLLPESTPWLRDNAEKMTRYGIDGGIAVQFIRLKLWKHTLVSMCIIPMNELSDVCYSVMLESSRLIQSYNDCKKSIISSFENDPFMKVYVNAAKMMQKLMTVKQFKVYIKLQTWDASDRVYGTVFKTCQWAIDEIWTIDGICTYLCRSLLNVKVETFYPELERNEFEMIDAVYTRPCKLCMAGSSMKCSRCQSTMYCSVLCSNMDWKRHKNECSTPQ